MAAMDHLVQQVNQLILRPELHDILAILKGARNGFVYGVSEWIHHRTCESPAAIDGDCRDNQMKVSVFTDGLDTDAL